MTVRPEIQDENIERLNKIIDRAVTVPLSSDELSINKQVQIVTAAVWDEFENADIDEHPELVIDRHRTSGE